jgi:tight adherence protein C
MAITIAALLFIFLMGIISWYGYVTFAKPARILEQLGSQQAVSHRADSDAPMFGVVKALQWVGEQVPISPQDVGVARRFLIAGGFRNDSYVMVYYGAKIVLAALALFFAITGVYPMIENRVLSKVVLVAIPAFGFYLPNLILDWFVDRRRETIRFALPDALDLLVVCVEAGLGLDQALRTVSRELVITHPEMCEELQLISLEMRAGTSRSQALANLAKRTMEPEVQKLVAILQQTDRFGTSMAESLRTHSDFMRIRRRQEAEERAGKVGVKLVFPIFFFVLPSMILVAAGPGLLRLFKELFPMMENASF